MGTRFKVGGFVLLTLCCVSAQETSSIEAKGSSSSESTPSNPRIVNLKHRRYKSLRDNVTSSHERIPLPNIEHPIIHEHIHYDDINPHIKSARNGFQLQKSPPDLQFGLAFTVPFVSLSTDKILGLTSGKNYDSVSSLFKLNFSGLLLAAVVGVIALAGIFLPSFLQTGLGPHGLLDSLIPHFHDAQYNDYGTNGNGWDKGTWKDTWNKDWNGRRNGRAENAIGTLGFGVLKLVEKFKSGVSTVEKCVVQRVCNEKKLGKGKVLQFVGGLGENEVVKDVGVYKVLKRVIDGDSSVCSKVEGVEVCKEFKGVEEGFMELISGFKESGDGEKNKGE